MENENNISKEKIEIGDLLIYHPYPIKSGIKILLKECNIYLVIDKKFYQGIKFKSVFEPSWPDSYGYVTWDTREIYDKEFFVLIPKKNKNE